MRFIRVPRVLGLGQASTLAQAIITQEGTCPSPTNCIGNNPGNLIFAGQPGATPGPNGFAVFDTYQDGYNALINQLNLYANGTCAACGGEPLTIEQMTAIYAPAGQGSNNPTVYAQNIASALGVSTDASLASVMGTPDLTAGTSSVDLSSIDLSSLGIPFSIDPTTLAVLAVSAVVVLALMLRR